MIVNFSPKKLSEFLFYSRTLNKEKSIDSHRMFSSKTGEYLGEMITYPQDFYYFNLEFPGVRSLYIDYLKVFRRNEGLGTKFLDFAKIIDEKDYEAAYELLTESVTVVSILEKARSKAGIKF